MLCSPLNRKTMGISIHVRGITKWGRRDCVTAHGLRTYSARTVSSSPRRRSPSVPVRMIRPGIRVVVGGTSTVSGSRRIIPNNRRCPGRGAGGCQFQRAVETSEARLKFKLLAMCSSLMAGRAWLLGGHVVIAECLYRTATSRELLSKAWRPGLRRHRCLHRLGFCLTSRLAQGAEAPTLATTAGSTWLEPECFASACSVPSSPSQLKGCCLRGTLTSLVPGRCNLSSGMGNVLR